MKITSEKVVNQWVEYTLTNDNGISVSFLDFGGIITKIITPNKEGKLENIVLGYKDYRKYESNPYFLGAIIGRVAGRIEQASFRLDGQDYFLEKNDGNHNLHSGSTGFHKVIWQATPFEEKNHIGVKLQHSSPHGEGGYPGNINVTVTYTLSNKNEFNITYEAVSDRKTVLTLTNHTYFNLTGDLKETVEQHSVKMDSNKFLELNQELIPTGKVMNVSGTTFDFQNGRKLITGLQSDHPQNVIVGNGYDHYFLLNTPSIEVEEEKYGRVMHVETDQPGVVMYTSNTLGEGENLREATSRRYLGVCFETQGSPASLLHSKLPSITIDPGKKYKKQTTFTFHYK